MQKGVIHIMLILILIISISFCFNNQANAYYGLFGIGLSGGLYGFTPFANYGGLITTPGMITNIGFNNLLSPYGY